MPKLRETAPSSAWVLTDGKAGDLAQCVGVAEALGCPFETRQVAPRAPFSWWLPFGPTDPREWETRPGSPIAPPYPDIAIASGRRAAGYLRRIKRLSRGRTFTVFLKDPRTGPDAADLIWVPEHDRLRGRNVLVTPTSPHRFSAAKLGRLRAEKVPEIDRLKGPRVAVLVGGDSRHHDFTEDDQNRFLTGLRQLVLENNASLMITASRRTPPALAYGLSSLAKSGGHLYWTGKEPNPLGHYLAKADAIIATADSTNMIGEATATGKPVHVFHPSGGHDKITRFLGSLERIGAVHPFPGPLKTTTYEPIDATPVIAERILSDYAALRQRDALEP
ncbi:mitochondrial fission ELM1 family protein [Roseibium sediminicola]|uniref:Mitochondrial fission ELM1 family protein n=1 Tax=Roseibium sediminicola TaxID=2933272 RepID=A0ABT0GU98_9HYPH|nr:mitochondrial fission ELM1 family protein [Roseibium sp. CAU 1639]MCK7612657.1 mitochondrial fission ELM1 family protein [Roseibium sp. CAU 1639]